MNLAIERDSKTLKTRLAAAQWALEADELGMAEQNATAALQIEPTSLDAMLLTGLVARYKNDLSGAEKIFTQAHLRSPAHLGAMSQLALVLIEQPTEEKRNLALQYAQVMVRLFSDLTKSAGREARVTLGWILYKLGRQAQAAQQIQAALRAGAVSADSAYHAARIFHDSDLKDASKKILESTLGSKRSFPNRKAAENLLQQLQ